MSPRWAALACDYDGTLASSSRVRTATLEALCQVRYRKLLPAVSPQFCRPKH